VLLCTSVALTEPTFSDSDSDTGQDSPAQFVKEFMPVPVWYRSDTTHSHPPVQTTCNARRQGSNPPLICLENDGGKCLCPQYTNAMLSIIARQLQAILAK